jgi:hypothetical protein
MKGNGRVWRGLLVATLALALGAAAEIAQADPIVISRGSIVYSRSNQASFDLQDQLGFAGGGFAAEGDFGDNASESWTPAHACFPCTPGQVINPSVSESFTNTFGNDVGVGGMVFLNGVTHGIRSFSISLLAGDVIVPIDAEKFWSTTAPFSFHGSITAAPPGGASQAFNVIGQGSVRLAFLEDHSWFASEFRFAPAAAVPEPATLLLVIPSAAWLIRRSRGSGRAPRHRAGAGGDSDRCRLRARDPF